MDEGPTFAFHQHVTADSPEAAVYLTGDRFNLVAGGSSLSGSELIGQPLSASPLLRTQPFDVNDHSLWFYGNFSAAPVLRFTLGGHYEQLTTTVRNIRALSVSEYDPKLGVSWDVLPSTTVRAAFFDTLARPLIGDLSFQSGQTIEPTQIAGFNQFFGDTTGTKARRWGVGIDQKFPNPFLAGNTLLLGGEWSQRQLEAPETFGVLTLVPPHITELDANERYGRGYLSWLLSERVAFNTAIDYETFATESVTTIQLLQVPVELRYFDPNGLLGLVRTTIAREQGQFFDLSGNVVSGNATFASVDMGIGWRFPGRPFIATLEVQNLLDTHFHFQDTDPLNQRLFPRRTVLARITARL
jgi:outer membrane receptor protein involved in Fe transport